MAHNFGSRYARKLIKGSKDADHSLPKQIGPKNGSLNWRPWPGKVGQKTQKYTPLVTSPREPQIHNEKIFQSQLEDFLNPWTD